MTLINLTESFIEHSKFPTYQRARTLLHPDFYYASSLSAVDEFTDNPPKKPLLFYFTPVADILLHNLEIRLSADSFDKDDTASFQEMDKGKSFPIFEIKDSTRRRFAHYITRSAEYLDTKAHYGFNQETFVTIPKVYLRYNHRDDGGTVEIFSLNASRPKSKSKSLKERIMELAPEFPGLIPAPQPS